MNRIIYMPLEPYRERYTWQMSAPVTGWIESRWRQAGIPYVRIEGERLSESPHVTTGVVLDAPGRTFWCCSQMMKLMEMIQAGQLTSEDAIFFDDFWHPGIEGLPYVLHFLPAERRPKLYAFLYAQSVDVFDFTYPMRDWMRPMERGIGKMLDGIFVTSTELKDLCVLNGIGYKDTIHVIGLLYNSDEVISHFPAKLPVRKKQVIYSSRWDKEKCPWVFLETITQVMARRDDISFVVTTSAPRLRSNNPKLIARLLDKVQQYPNNVFLKENLTKEMYYEELLSSFIQMNTADQDWVSWTLLEATTAGCRPLYPYFRSFPEALNYDHRYLYVKGSAEDAADKIERLMRHYPSEMIHMDSIYSPFDRAWKRMINIMKEEDYEPLYRG